MASAINVEYLATNNTKLLLLFVNVLFCELKSFHKTFYLISGNYTLGFYNTILIGLKVSIYLFNSCLTRGNSSGANLCCILLRLH
jgi:hypothetical protein